MTKVSPVSTLDASIREVLIKSFGLVRNPALKKNGWWIKTPVYDDDFEQEIAQHYMNANEALETATQSIIQEISNLISSAQPEKITKDRTFDPPKENIIKVYKDGMAAKTYNIAIDEYHTNLINSLKGKP